MALITGSWDKTKLVCGNHKNTENLPVMTLKLFGRTLFYACPHCNNRLSSFDYEKMLGHIASVLADAEENNVVQNLENYHWKKKAIEYTVKHHKGDNMVVAVVDATLVGKC